MEIILPDGSKKILEEGATVYDVAASIGTSLAKAALAGKINGELVDVTAQVTDGATIEIITNKSPEALSIMRHSCAHIMAEAVQELFPGAQIAFGPATDNGYFYDFELPENISSDDFAAIEKKWQEKWLEEKPFTTLFVDGNHENFDLLNTLPERQWNGGRVHVVREHVLHLMRGHSVNSKRGMIFPDSNARKRLP